MNCCTSGVGNSTACSIATSLSPPIHPSFLPSVLPSFLPLAGLCYGGYARLASVVDSIRSTGPTLLLDGGDEFTGSVFSYVYRGAEAFPLQNMLGITAMVGAAAVTSIQ